MSDDNDVRDLVSSDKLTFTVLASIASMSTTLRDLMEDSASGPIPLPDIASKPLQRVVEYCMHHKDDTVPPPVLDTTKTRIPDKPTPVGEWDRQFCAQMDQAELFDVILAANYLDIRPLLDLGCRIIAESVIGKKPKEIYAMFKIEKELTPEEEQKVREDNPWLEDK